MSDENIRNVFFSPPPNLPPDIKIRYWGTSLVMLLVVGFTVFYLLALLTWRNIPWIGPSLTDPLNPHFKFWMQSVIYLITNGQFFGSGVEWYWSHVNQMPFWAVQGRVMLNATGGLVMGLWVAWTSLRPRDQLIHIGGMQLKKGKDALKEAASITKRNAKDKTTFMYIHPALGLPKQAFTTHTLIYGGTGAGKTVILHYVLQQIFAADHKLILYDIKGDFTAKYPKALLISPWDERSAIWSIADDINTDSTARAFSSSLYPTKPGSDNAFFQSAAASILFALIKSLYQDFGMKWGWKELAQRCSLPQKKLYHYMTQFNPSQANLIEDAESKTTSSVLGTFSDGLFIIDQLAQAWGNEGDKKRHRLSLNHWIRDDYKGPRQIILQGGEKKLQAAYISAMINSLTPKIVSPMLKDDELGRSFFFVIDEASTLEKMRIEELFALSRSKGGVILMGLQDLSQIREIYGEDFSKALSAMVGTHIICRMGPGETRQKVAQMLGKRRVGVIQNNYSSNGGTQQSVSTSYQEQDRDVINETELTTGLGKNEDLWKGIRAIYLSGNRTMVLDYPFPQLPDQRPARIEADWCKPFQDLDPVANPKASASAPKGALRVLPGAPSTASRVTATKAPPKASAVIQGEMERVQLQALNPENSRNQASHGDYAALKSERDQRIAERRAEREGGTRSQAQEPEKPKVEQPTQTPQIIFHPGDPDYAEALAQAQPMEEEGGDEVVDAVSEHLITEALPGGELLHVVSFLEELENKPRKPQGPTLEIINTPWKN